jgi:hypothetical protein
MEKFLVVHRPIYVADSLDGFADIACKIFQSLSPDIKWRNAWWAAEKELLFCEWEAKNIDILLQTLEIVKSHWTTEIIYPVVWIDPEWWCNEGTKPQTTKSIE